MRVRGSNEWFQTWVLGHPPWRNALAVWVIVFLVINATTGNLLAGTTIRQYRLAMHGRSTTGTVTALNLSDHGGCTFAYKVDGVRYSRSEQACGFTESNPEVGDLIKVNYEVDDPGIATTSDAKSAFWQGLLFIFGAPTFLAVFVFFGWRRRYPEVGSTVAHRPGY